MSWRLSLRWVLWVYKNISERVAQAVNWQFSNAKSFCCILWTSLVLLRGCITEICSSVQDLYFQISKVALNIVYFQDKTKAEEVICFSITVWKGFSVQAPSSIF